MLALALVVLVVVIAVDWLWRSAAGDALRSGWLLSELGSVRDSRFEAAFVLGGFVLAELVMIPVTILIAAIALVFAPVKAFIYALAGSTLSALVCFVIGRRLGHERLRRLAPQRAQRISEYLGRRGLPAIALMRMLPLGPFTLGNLIAGVSHVRLWDFALGTLAGMAPGIALIVALAHGASALLRDPNLASLAMLALPALAMIVAAVALRRMLRRLDRPHDATEESPHGAPH